MAKVYIKFNFKAVCRHFDAVGMCNNRQPQKQAYLKPYILAGTN